MNYKVTIYELLKLIDEASLITPKNKPIRLHVFDEETDFFKLVDIKKLAYILEKLEQEEVIKIIEEPIIHILTNGQYTFGHSDFSEDPRDRTCYLFEKGKNFEKYLDDLSWDNEILNSYNKQEDTVIEKNDEGEEISYRITYNEKVREIIINDWFLLSKPDFNSENEKFFTYIFKNPNKKILLKEIENVIGEQLRKNIHSILNDLGFKGTLLKAFFNVSNTAIFFRNPVKKIDLEELKISLLRIQGK